MPQTAEQAHRLDARQEAVLTGVREGMTLQRACDAAKVPIGTCSWWIENNTNGFEPQWRKAKRARAHLWAEMTVDLADDAEQSKESIAKAKLCGDVRWRVIQKQAPDDYGDKADQHEPQPPTQIVFGNQSGPAPELPGSGGATGDDAREQGGA